MIKKQSSPKYWIIKQDVWDAPVALFINIPDKEMTDYLNEIYTGKAYAPKGEPEFSTDVNQLGVYIQSLTDFKEIGVRRLIWVKDYKKGNLNHLGALTHEIMHYVHRTLKDKGMTLCSESEEAYTYLMEYTLKECWKILNKSKS